MIKFRSALKELFYSAILAGSWVGFAALFFSPFPVRAQAYAWTTLTGNRGGAGINDGPITTAHFLEPYGIAVASDGTVYISDAGTNTIRKISVDKVVSTIFGSPLDNENDTSAPSVLATDQVGNIYWIGDDAVQKITIATGELSLVAGKLQSHGYRDGNGSFARFSGAAVTPDKKGNLYVADFENALIRKIDPIGNVTTYAGAYKRFGAKDGPRKQARFGNPISLVVDDEDNLLVADQYTSTIRKISSKGIVSTLAGSPGAVMDGLGSAAHFQQLNGIAIDHKGNSYVTDYYSVRKITAEGQVTTLPLHSDEKPFFFSKPPGGIAVGVDGNLLVADPGAHTVIKITPNGNVTVFGGLPTELLGYVDGPVALAKFGRPKGMLADANDDIFVIDTNNQAIREITPAGQVTTYAGGTASPNNSNLLYEVDDLALDPTNGNFLVDSFANQWMSKVTQDGKVTDVSKAAELIFNLGDTGVAGDGTVYKVSSFTRQIMKLDSNGDFTAFVGRRGSSGQIDGPPESASLGFPAGLTFDDNNNLYVTDDTLLREITPAGVVTTIATLTLPSSLKSIARAKNGDFFVLAGNEVIKVTSDGSSSVIGGAFAEELIGDGVGRMARFSNPAELALDSNGTIYVSDFNNNRIVKGSPLGYQPDIILQDEAGVNYGDNLYNLGAFGQSLAIKAKGTQASSIKIRVQNDGAMTDSFIISGEPGDRRVHLQYFANGVDVTAEIVAGVMQTGPLVPQETYSIEVKVNRGKSGKVNAVGYRFQAVSLHQSTAQDVGSFTITK